MHAQPFQFSLLISLILGFSGIVRADTLPPLGARLYELGPGGVQSKQPVKILSADERRSVTTVFMRDPSLPGPERQVAARPPATPSQPKLTYQESKLNFPATAINGRYTTPRVEFADRRLAIDQAEERLDFDFLDRLLETARRQEALLTSPAP